MDFDVVYAPVVGFPNVLLIQALPTQLGWDTDHLDYKNAFLNGDIDTEVNVVFPQNLPDFLLVDNCFRLVKALY